ncbi:hypothetical protein G7B40_025960 [Aetokthonos hydrillicola Thurmond2011]|jgi:hypothetical protein|uniref:Uncharacterized protein n=1 Tax=Aetokthonos hydrillicola Thurmond2011 TaxID=2712845 RepID=A0AAP5MAB9_9CYAN|nr:hypothetical protein [Aetokthonos hydrillicola]MBO3464112.1 hypothetical protein [Aetokthonos hydrillicola CCALA 1050]MBW4587638.1 hypothetical protein [Aetokthonos hydrillicola CCALA 1050]MDR9897980.1 hypothetical protein [Aetokthonos hydrillicola Thurmond2011]
MSQRSNSEHEDELRDEYDFTKMQILARGPGRKQANILTVALEPDVAEMFPDSAAVNEALRFLIRITKNSTAQT